MSAPAPLPRLFRQPGSPRGDGDLETLLVAAGQKLCPLRLPRSLRFVAHAVFERRDYELRPFHGYAPATVVDIGANVGAYALYAALRYPGCRVLAYEPSPASFELLARNLAGVAGVEVFPYGLWDRAGSFTLHRGRNNPGESSLLAGAEQLEAGEPVEVRQASRELALRLPAPPSVLKIDTEGVECAILADLEPMLDAVDFVLVEYHREDDRRDIDRRLASRFLLYGGHAERPHRGVLRFLGRRLLALDPDLARFVAAEERKSPDAP